MNERKREKLVVVFSVFWLATTAPAQSVRTFVEQGNNLYAEGGFNQAIDKYDQALIEKPDAAEPKFNKANAYYRLDDLGGAIELYGEVASESKDMKLVAKARYNLGNCHFQQGLKQQDSNLEKALEGLRESIGHWRQVLEIEPENEKAAKNIEVARLIIKDIIDRLNKQKQQQQEQAEKQKQLQEKLKELLEKQQALAQRTQDTKDQADKGDISQEQARENYAEQANEQSQLRQETEQTAQELMQQQDANTPPQMQEAAAELGQAAADQTNAQEQLNAADGAQAKQSEDKAAEHIENALKALSQGDQQGKQQQQQQQTQDPNQAQEPNQPQQRQEQKTQAAEATAQEILDKEQQEKKMRQTLQRGGYQKVDKDW